MMFADLRHPCQTRTCYPRTCAVLLRTRRQFIGVQLDRLRVLSFVYLGVVVGLLGWESVHAQQHDALLDQLYRRRLYRVAASYCEESLLTSRQNSGGAVEQAWWMAQRLDALTKLAVHESPNDPAIWEEINELRTSSEGQLGQTVARGIVELQFQLAQLWRATALASRAKDAAVGPYFEQERNSAIERFRIVLRDLQKLDEELVRSRPRVSANSDAERFEWQRLRTQIVFKMAEAYRRQADLFESSSPDRISLLNDALSRYQQVGRASRLSPIVLDARLNEIRCLRQLGKLVDAKKRLEKFPIRQVSSTVRRQYATETAAWLIDQGTPETAAKLLASELKTELSSDSGDVLAAAQVTLVRAYIAAARAAESSPAATPTADQWRTLAVEQLEAIEQTQSAYWFRKAQSLVSASASNSDVDNDVELLAKMAANAYQRGQVDDAIEGFQKAALLAKEVEDTDRFFELAFQAAAVLHEERRHQPAKEAFQSLALDVPAHRQAAEAHWLAVLNAASLVRTDAAQLGEYQTLLEAQRRNWPKAERADEASFLLAKLYRQQRQLNEAIAVLTGIKPSFRDFRSVMATLRESYVQRLNDSGVAAAERQQRAAEFRDYLIQTADKCGGEARCEALVTAVEMSLLYTPLAPRLATKPLADSNDAAACRQYDPDRVAALLGLAAALASSNDLSRQAESLWQQVRWSATDWVVPLLRRIHGEIEGDATRSAQQRNRLVELELSLLERLRDVSAVSQDPDVRGIQAQAYRRLGKQERAITLLESVVSEYPRSFQYRAQLAQLREDAPRQASHESALRDWRTAARLASDQSDDWWEAKLGIARLLVKLGQRQRARDSIELLRALHPSLGGETFRRRFELLLRQPAP